MERGSKKQQDAVNYRSRTAGGGAPVNTKEKLRVRKGKALNAVDKKGKQSRAEEGETVPMASAALLTDVAFATSSVNAINEYKQI